MPATPQRHRAAAPQQAAPGSAAESCRAGSFFAENLVDAVRCFCAFCTDRKKRDRGGTTCSRGEQRGTGWGKQRGQGFKFCGGSTAAAQHAGGTGYCGRECRAAGLRHSCMRYWNLRPGMQYPGMQQQGMQRQNQAQRPLQEKRYRIWLAGAAGSGTHRNAGPGWKEGGAEENSGRKTPGAGPDGLKVRQRTAALREGSAAAAGGGPHPGSGSGAGIIRLRPGSGRYYPAA